MHDQTCEVYECALVEVNKSCMIERTSRPLNEKSAIKLLVVYHHNNNNNNQLYRANHNHHITEQVIPVMHFVHSYGIYYDQDILD